jgi:hypothetical protein
MDKIQIICFIGIILITTLKAISFKPCANHLPSHYTPLFISFWMMLSVVCVFPYFTDTVFKDLGVLSYELLYGVLKGLFFFYYIDYGQKLSKESASSKTFVGAIAIGVMAILGVFILDENLNKYQILSALLIFVLGVLYYFKGHLSETSFLSQKSFFIMLILSVIISVVDHLALSVMHWFTYLLLNIPILFLMSYLYTRKKGKILIKFFFSDRRLLIAAFLYVIAEFYFTRVRVSILPITTANIAALMSVPVIMVVMNIFWNESTMKKQLSFGLLAFFIGLVSFI